MKEKLIAFHQSLLAALALSAAQTEMVDKIAHYMQGEEVRMGMVHFHTPQEQETYKEVAASQMFDYVRELQRRLLPEATPKQVIQLIDLARGINRKADEWLKQHETEICESIAHDEAMKVFSRLGVAGHA